ncbi:MAG: universal stress protein [Haloarculaceae archaeon]
MDIDTVLVPVDQSEESVVAVEYAAAVADRYDAGIHVLSVLDEDVSRALERGTMDEADVAADHEAFIERVLQLENVDWKVDADGGDPETVPLTHSTVHGFSPSRLMRHPGSAVLDVAEEVDADFVVVPRESVEGGTTKVLEKADVYVLSYADQPVLSV